MVNVDDVAAYILAQKGPMSAMKLQKLLYYAQAWSLVWDEAQLFREPIRAWADGPVVRALWQHHRGAFTLSPPWPYGDADKLSFNEKGTVDVILRYYGDKDGQWLSDLTHSERPWIEAREGLGPGERGNRVIDLKVMADYYGSIRGK